MANLIGLLNNTKRATRHFLILYTNLAIAKKKKARELTKYENNLEKKHFEI